MEINILSIKYICKEGVTRMKRKREGDEMQLMPLLLLKGMRIMS